MVARRVGLLGGGYYASPGYLERRGEPKHPKVPRGDRAEWFFVVDGRRSESRSEEGVVVSDLALGVRAAAAGLGIVRTPLPMVLGYLNDERLVDVLGKWTPPGVPVQAVLPPGGATRPQDACVRRCAPGDGYTRRPRRRRAMKGAPALAIQQLAGHENVQTTLGYMHLARGETERAIRLLDAPADSPKEAAELRQTEGKPAVA